MGQVNTPLLSRFPHNLIDRALPTLVIPLCRGPDFSPSLRVASSPNRVLWHYDLPWFGSVSSTRLRSTLSLDLCSTHLPDSFYGNCWQVPSSLPLSHGWSCVCKCSVWLIPFMFQPDFSHWSNTAVYFCFWFGDRISAWPVSAVTPACLIGMSSPSPPSHWQKCWPRKAQKSDVLCNWSHPHSGGPSSVWHSLGKAEPLESI